MNDWTAEQLKPFGLVVTSARQGTDLHVISATVLKQWVEDHRVIVLRGFVPLIGDELPEFCYGWASFWSGNSEQ